NDNIVQFANPHKVVVKGRPKGTSHHSKSVLQEISNKKKHEYTCGFCKELGHNIATCMLLDIFAPLHVCISLFNIGY
ncbi:17871_t:CDS:2, partial [Racocetra persica]